MSILSASNLGKYFGPDEIFSGISLAVPAGARIALVGPNGAGKTTLLNLLAGIDSPTSGEVSVARGKRLSFLPQRPELAGEHSLWQEQLRAFGDLRQMERQLAELERQMAEVDDASRVMDAYGQLQTEFERAGRLRLRDAHQNGA